MKDTRLAQDLTRLRKDRDKTRTQAAADMGFSYNSLMSYEQGDRVPSFHRLPIIAKYYNMTIQELFYPEIER